MSSKIFNTIPHEILDSRLFKFEVILPSVHEHYCQPCNIVFSTDAIQCPQCQNRNLIRRNKTIFVDLTANVSIDYETVEKSLVDIPAQYAFWCAVYAEAKFRSNLLERVVKTSRALAHDEIVQASLEQNVKLPQDAVKTLIEKDERVNRAEGELAKANMIAAKLYYMIEALRMKADLARSLTSLKRSEQNGS